MAEEDGKYCAYVNNHISTDLDKGEFFVKQLVQHDASNVTAENTSVRCKAKTEFCYSFWHIDPVDRNKVSILLQGKLFVDLLNSDVCIVSDKHWMIMS